MKLPTDLEILEFIYKKYYGVYNSFSKEKKIRETKIYVPIKISEIADNFQIDKDLIFGRLYYYLDEKYRYRNDNNSIVSFFSLSIGRDKHCVNYVLLSSVLANLQEENKRYWTTTIIAFYATVLAAIAVIVSIVL